MNKLTNRSSRWYGATWWVSMNFALRFSLWWISNILLSQIFRYAIILRRFRCCFSTNLISFHRLLSRAVFFSSFVFIFSCCFHCRLFVFGVIKREKRALHTDKFNAVNTHKSVRFGFFLLYEAFWILRTTSTTIVNVSFYFYLDFDSIQWISTIPMKADIIFVYWRTVHFPTHSIAFNWWNKFNESQ